MPGIYGPAAPAPACLLQQGRLRAAAAPGPGRWASRTAPGLLRGECAGGGARGSGPRPPLPPPGGGGGRERRRRRRGEGAGGRRPRGSRPGRTCCGARGAGGVGGEGVRSWGWRPAGPAAGEWSGFALPAPGPRCRRGGARVAGRAGRRGGGSQRPATPALRQPAGAAPGPAGLLPESL